MKKEIPARIEMICDRCKREVLFEEDLKHIDVELANEYSKPEAEYDLCPACFTAFKTFMRYEDLFP